jgi:hypothetical protein
MSAVIRVLSCFSHFVVQDKILIFCCLWLKSYLIMIKIRGSNKKVSTIDIFQLANAWNDMLKSQ